MNALLTTFGFTTLESTLWNLAADLAFIGIIVAVLRERGRNVLLTIGAAILAVYSAFFLKDAVFATLQTLVTVSGAMQLARVERGKSIATMLALLIVAMAFFAFTDAWQSVSMTVGVLGLLGIAFGIILLPQRKAFALMAVGGVLLVVYAFVASAWVFFWLNIVFTLANIKEFVAYRDK